MNIRTECTEDEIQLGLSFMPRAVVFVGMLSDPNINDGEEIPLLMSTKDASDPSSINNRERWNTLARESNTKAFIDCFGYPPSSDEELNAWVRSLCMEGRKEGVSN